MPTPSRATPPRRFRTRWAWGSLLALWLSIGVWQTNKPLPPGINIAGPAQVVATQDVRFLYDLTFAAANGATRHEQQIFDEVLRLIDSAHSFIVADFFLLNDAMGASSTVQRRLSRELADRLLARKAAQPDLTVLLITDPINEVYAGAPSALFTELRTAGIDVVVTNLQPLRDSNPGYSAIWRSLGQWWGNSAHGGILPNPFTSDGSQITLRSWLSLLNFKANHRKLLVVDRSDGTLAALVTSANPHDASSAHSNVAVSFSGAPTELLLDGELSVAQFSGWRGDIATDKQATAPHGVTLRYLTEAAILEHLLATIDAAQAGDAVAMAMFYLSERSVIDALLRAAERGVRVQLLLDPNKDAFGRQKDGVPNRPVANELVTRSNGRIDVRWYDTRGEQFHTKLTLVRRGDQFIASLGSANLTRRNLRNYNLEANVALAVPAEHELADAMTSYFNRLWNNDDAHRYSLPFEAYRDASRLRYWQYRVMEATGLSTF